MGDIPHWYFERYLTWDYVSNTLSLSRWRVIVVKKRDKMSGEWGLSWAMFRAVSIIVDKNSLRTVTVWLDYPLIFVYVYINEYNIWNVIY